MTDKPESDVKVTLRQFLLVEDGVYIVALRELLRDGRLATKRVREIERTLRRHLQGSAFAELIQTKASLHLELANAGAVREKNAREFRLAEKQRASDRLESHLRSLHSLTSQARIDDVDKWLSECFSPQPRVAYRDEGESRGPLRRLFPDGTWQASAAEAIAGMASRFDLEEALGPALLEIVEAHYGDDGAMVSAPPTVSLAEALICRYGGDLLRACGDLREGLAKAKGIVAPRKFHSGKETAVSFVGELGLPRELAGTPTPSRESAAEIVAGLLPLRDLESYQEQLKVRMVAALQDGRSELYSLPTGAGKTRVAVEAIVDFLLDRSRREATKRPYVVWVAHTVELCAQATDTLRKVWAQRSSGSGLLLVNTAGQASVVKDALECAQDPWAAAVVVTTPKPASTLLKPAGELTLVLEATGTAALGGLVIDEAHRAAAKTYRRLVDLVRNEGASAPAVVGLTATPYRNSAQGITTDALQELFATLVVPHDLGDDPRSTLVERGYLATIIDEEVQGSDLRDREVEAPSDDEPSNDAPQNSAQMPDEILDNLLARWVGEDIDRQDRVFAYILRICRNSPSARVLYFGPTIEDAEAIMFRLRWEGVTAEVITGKTPRATRQDTVRRFRDGQVTVLSNHGVLTTGFDDPQITHVVIARPTLSMVLYEQMIGRGLRGPKFGGTATCIVGTVRDEFIVRPSRPMVWDLLRSEWGANVIQAR